MAQTSIEKITQRYSIGLEPGQVVKAGDLLAIRPKHIMTHDNTGAVIPKFRSIGATTIADPKQPVFGMDHDVQNTTPENLGKYAKIEKFAREQGVDYYPPGRGIAHQIMVEEGYVTPGSFCVGSDSHSNIYGAVAAVGTPVVRTDAAAIWATGQTWWQVPMQIRVELAGSLRNGVTGKDVIIALCGFFNNDEALNGVIEFTGEGVAGLSMDERLTISNMTTEWGALAGMFPFDAVLKDYLLGRAERFAGREAPRYTAADVEAWWADRGSFASDADAHYAREMTLDLTTVSPHVSGPNSVKVMTSVHEMQAEKKAINKAYLMSCVNARLEDIAAAADVVRGKRVADGVEFYLAPASSEVRDEAQRLGWWGDLLDAGAIELPAGCGACIGLGAGTLNDGEVGISATNRNFQGRMGSREALCYLASPSVVAASAVAGFVCAPVEMDEVGIEGGYRVVDAPALAGSATKIRDDFPRSIKGRALYLPLDNLNTDGIYGKDVTYRDDITLEEQGQYAMLNYDPDFQAKANEGDIIVGGRNFGSGSSREQAATALASRGIRMVIAASFSQTYKRNAFNNGFICIDCPALTDALQESLGDGERTLVGPLVEVDFEASVAMLGGKAFAFDPLGPVAQELVAKGGSEAVVQGQLAG